MSEQSLHAGLRRWCGLLVAVVLIAVGPSVLRAQIAGEPYPDADTAIIFESPRPLLDNADADIPARWGAGLDLLFSSSGWGAGGFLQRALDDNLTIFTSLAVSGKRNTDELESLMPNNMAIVVGKVNRLFIVPVTLGLQYRLFSSSLQESFRPFVSAGVTPTLIMATPYVRDDIFYEFFTSFGQAQAYTRVGGMLGVGAFFGPPGKGSLLGVQIRYFTIPFGGVGLESMAGSPVTDFGGVFLSLTVGSGW